MLRAKFPLLSRKENGMAESLVLVLVGKYGPLSEQVEKRIRQAGEEQLCYWMQHAFAVKSLDELFFPE